MQTKRGSIHSNSGSIQTKPGSIQTKRGLKLLEPGSIQSNEDENNMFGINSVPTRRPLRSNQLLNGWVSGDRRRPATEEIRAHAY